MKKMKKEGRKGSKKSMEQKIENEKEWSWEKREEEENEKKERINEKCEKILREQFQ